MLNSVKVEFDYYLYKLSHNGYSDSGGFGILHSSSYAKGASGWGLGHGVLQEKGYMHDLVADGFCKYLILR